MYVHTHTHTHTYTHTRTFIHTHWNRAARHKLPYSLLMWAIEHQDDQAALAQAADMFDALIARSAMLLAQ